MTKNSDTNRLAESNGVCGRNAAERNRYFHGKLMTARDMLAEQQYHRAQQAAHARHVSGAGIADGLEVDISTTDDETELSVTIQPGYGIDCCGRQVIIPREATKTVELETTSGDEQQILVLRFDECVTESVPIPGSEDACEQECAYNRIIETFDIRVETLPSGANPGKPVPPVSFPQPPRSGEERIVSQRIEVGSRNGGGQVEKQVEARRVKMMRMAAFEETASESVEEGGFEEEIEERIERRRRELAQVEEALEDADEDETQDLELKRELFQRKIDFLEGLLDGDVPDRDGLVAEVEERREELAELGDEAPEELVREFELFVAKVKFLDQIGEGPPPEERDREPDYEDLTKIAREWDTGDQYPVGCADDGRHAIFLGRIVSDGESVELDETGRPVLYSNDMLYSAIARHTADFRNPHQVSLETRPRGTQVGRIRIEDDESPRATVDFVSPDQFVGIQARANPQRIELTAGDALESMVDKLVTNRIEPLERYLRDRSLKYTHQTFTRGIFMLFDQPPRPFTYGNTTEEMIFMEYDQEGIIGEIQAVAQAAIDGRDHHPREAYVDVIEALFPHQEAFVNLVEQMVEFGVISAPSYERLQEAFDSLEESLAAATNDLDLTTDLAVAQDEFCETVVLLEQPEEVEYWAEFNPQPSQDDEDPTISKPYGDGNIPISGDTNIEAGEEITIDVTRQPGGNIDFESTFLVESGSQDQLFEGTLDFTEYGRHAIGEYEISAIYDAETLTTRTLRIFDAR